MLELLNPAAAWWLLLVPALVALYLLRPRPQRKAVSSLRLWQALPDIERPRARLRRLPRSLLLLLQALLLLAGAVALMQPAFSSSLGKRHLVILLDASGSMQASDGASSRFEEAKAEARKLVAGLTLEERATILRVGTDVTTLCSACTRPDAEQAIAGARPGVGRADLSSALGVVAGLATHSEQGRVDAVLISDGAFDSLPAEGLPSSLRFVHVGKSADNRAITVLSARRPPDGSQGYEVYGRVENFGASEAIIEVSALADTVPLETHNLTLPPGGHADLIWQVPAGTARFTANMNSPDALAADNHTVLFLPKDNQYKVVVNAAQPALYRRVLEGIPGIQVTDKQSDIAPAFTVIEGRLPETLPVGSLLLVNPDGEPLPSQGDIGNVRPLSGAAAHPLLDGIDLGALIVQKAHRYGEVSWLEPLVQSEGGPLLLAGERDGRRIAMLTFDPADSNLSKLAAFPLLMSNVVDWLYPLAGSQALRPGERLYLSPGSTVDTPDGRNLSVSAQGTFADTEQQGLYTVKKGNETLTQFAVNMSDGQESDLAPRAHPELDRQDSATAAQGATRQEMWSPVAGLALLLLGGEWVFYCWKRGQA